MCAARGTSASVGNTAPTLPTKCNFAQKGVVLMAAILHSRLPARRLLVVVSLCTLSVAIPSPVHAAEWRHAVFGSRSASAMAYDSARQELILFGGLDAPGDTWAWNGSIWLRKSVDGPGPRSGHAMAYDAERRNIVLFGGSVSGTYSGETWLWDGSRWAKAAVTGPSARYACSMVYDAARKKVVLFGGNVVRVSGGEKVGEYVSDTWLWDGVAWTQATGTGPSARTRAGLVYDSVRREVVLFGGLSGGAEATWTWVWDGASWTPRSNSGPPAVEQPLLSFDEVRGQAVLTTQYPATPATWVWDGRQWAKKSPAAWPVFGWNSISSGLGQAGVLALGPANDWGQLQTWIWDGTTWSLKWTNGPGNSFRPALADDPARGRLVLFGGELSNGLTGKSSYSSDTWLWDGVRWLLSDAKGPSGRYNHLMAYDEARQQVVMYGGHDNKSSFRETWVWDGMSWTKAHDDGPLFDATGAGIPGYSMAYDASLRRVVLATRYYTGGLSYRGETWTWDGSRWDKISDSSPDELARGALVYDGARGELLCIPSVGLGTSSDLKISVLKGDRWVVKAASPIRGGAGVFYDSGQRKVVLFGGSGNACRNGLSSTCRDTWLWDGVGWAQDVEATFPGLTSNAAYDSTRGTGVAWDRQTWTYHSTPPRPAISSVVNGASFLPGISDGSWVSIVGSDLAKNSRAWRADEIANGKLPQVLDKVSVTIDGLPAAIAYISPNQLNVQAPSTGRVGRVSVVVTNELGNSAPMEAEVRRAAPGLFVFSPGGGKYPAALVADSSGRIDYLGPAALFAGLPFTRPAKPGETVVLYATGLGPTMPSVPAGQAYSGSAPTVDSVDVSIGGARAQVAFSGLVGPGLYQLNVVVPAAPSGDAGLSVEVNGAAAQGGLVIPVAPRTSP